MFYPSSVALFSNAIILTLLTLLTLPHPTTAIALRRSPTNSHSLLLQFGSAQTTHSFLAEAQPHVPISLSFHTSTPSILSWHDLSATRISPTRHNVSLTVAFEGLPGRARFHLTAAEPYQPSVTRRVAVDVLGVVLYDDGPSGPVVLSGDVGELVLPGPREAGAAGRVVRIAAYGGALGKKELLDGLLLTSKTIGGHDVSENATLLPEGSVRRDRDCLVVDTSPGVRGRGVVSVEVEALQLLGESFETAMFVRVV